MPGDVDDFLAGLARRDRERIARSVVRTFAVEQRVIEEYSAFTERAEKRLSVRVERGDGQVRANLYGSLMGDARSGGLAKQESPDGVRLALDGNTERRLATARRRSELMTRAVMRGLGRAGADMQMDARMLAREHAERMADAIGREEWTADLVERMDAARDALPDLGDDLDGAERVANDDASDIEETYNDDIAKLASLYLDSVKGRVSTWRTEPRVEAARAQVRSVGMHRGSVGNTVAGTARAAYRREMAAKGAAAGATHAERVTLKPKPKPKEK